MPKNNLVLKKMEEKGIRSIAQLCRLAKVNKSGVQTVHGVINLKFSPLKHVVGRDDLMEWRKPVLQITETLECEPEEIFPEIIRGVRISRGASTFVEISISDIRKLGRVPRELVSEWDPEKSLVFRRFQQTFVRAIKTLTPREKEVLNLRFGFDDGRELTFKQIGNVLRVSRHRAQQLFKKALRKMRQHSRADLLEEIARDLGFLPRT